MAGLIKRADKEAMDNIARVALHGGDDIPRPARFDDFVGQDDIKTQLKIHIAMGVKLGRPTQHILLTGPPGLGKTTLAKIVANELDAKMVEKNGPSIRKESDLHDMVYAAYKEPRITVIFIDEIHRIYRKIQEHMLTLMEDKKMMIESKDQLSGSVHHKMYKVPRIMFIGATTHESQLSPPFRSRFGIVHRLQLYADHELEQIVQRNAGYLFSGIPNVSVKKTVPKLIAMRSRGTARIANNVIHQVFAYVVHQGIKVVDIKVTQDAFKIFKINKWALSTGEQLILEVLNKTRQPMSVANLSAMLQQEIEVTKMTEQHLIRVGFVEIQHRGRAITKEGIRVIHAIKSGKGY